MFVQVSLAALRGVPADPTQRVSMAAYDIFHETLPNKQPRPARIVSSAAVTVGGDYRLTARIVREPGGMALELSPVAFDITRQQAENFALSPSLQRSICDAMKQAHVTEQAKHHARGVGRN